MSSPVDELLLASLERGDDSLKTGRYVITYKEGATAASDRMIGGLRTANASEFANQALTLESVDDAEAVVLPEIGVAIVSADVAEARNLSAQLEIASDDPVESIDPEYFVFAESVNTELAHAGHADSRVVTSNGNGHGDYLRGFLRAVEVLAKDLQALGMPALEQEEVIDALALGATWGLIACRVPQSARSGAGIKVAILDTGMDLGHPDFAGRPITSQTFVGQPVQDLAGHGTHCIGTACGTKSPSGSTPRYGIGYHSLIHAGKVLNNSGSGTQAGVLAGMNWAIANRCQVISMSLGASIGVQPSYTAAGQAALNHGLLIVAAAGNVPGAPTGAPANSPTIMAVASLDQNLSPSNFSSIGKIEIAAPGRDVFSSWPRPTKYRTISGTSMATPHVAGCAALWAQTSPNLRGMNLWRKLLATAKPLPFPASRVGAGLVQAP
jgi:subtilisin family serine protease